MVNFAVQVNFPVSTKLTIASKKLTAQRFTFKITIH